MLYHVDASEDQAKDFRTAYAASIGKVIENDTLEIVIAVDDISSLDFFVYPVIFGIAVKLKKFGVVDIGDIKVYLETKNNKSNFKSGLIIASYVSDDFLCEILSDSRATDTIFVTNMRDKLEHYLSHNTSVKLNDL